MEKLTFYILLLVVIGMLLVFLAIFSIRKIKREKKTKAQIEKDNRDDCFASCIFLSFLSLFGLIGCIVGTISQFSLVLFFLTLFLLFFFLFFLFEGINYLTKNNKIFFIKKIFAFLAPLFFGIGLLIDFILKKEWIRVVLISLVIIFILFRKKLERFYNKS